MTPNPLQQLYDEHDVMLRMIDHVHDLLVSPDDSERHQEFLDAISFFREYGDDYHHRKEEDIFFQRLAEAQPALQPIISSLSEHHAMFRESIREIEQALTDGNEAALQGAMMEYLLQLSDHISAENDELFVAAEEVFSEEEREKIGFLFEDHDREQGVERKRELEGYVAHLTE